MRSESLRFLPFLVGTFALYLMTLCPTVAGGDGGELIAVAYRLGVAHPPGYPLYTLLAHLFTRLPFGSVAWRVNLFSAVAMTGAVWFLLLVVRRWTGSFWAAVAAGMLFAFSPLVWRYAIVAEVFALGTLFAAAILYFTLRYLEDPRDKWATCWAATVGLACSHHHTIVLVAAPILALVAWRHFRHLCTPRVAATCLAVFLLGLAPYALLPAFSAKRLLVSWGDLTTWHGFWTHLLRREYGTFQLAAGPGQHASLLHQLGEYVLTLARQFLFVFMVPTAIGIGLALRGHRRGAAFGFVALVACCFDLGVFQALTNLDTGNPLFKEIQARFWILPNLFMAMFAGSGLVWLAGCAGRRRDRILAAVAVATCITAPALRFRAEDMSGNWLFESVGRATLAGLAPHALLLMRGDSFVNGVRYLQECEGVRPDVRAVPLDLLCWRWMIAAVHTAAPEVALPAGVYGGGRSHTGSFTLADLVGANVAKLPVYIGRVTEDEAKDVGRESELWNVGFVSRILPKSTPMSPRTLVEESAPFDRLTVPPRNSLRDNSWEAFVVQTYWARQLDRSRQIFAQATRLGDDEGVIRYGAGVLERVVRELPTPPPRAYRDLGVAYQFLARSDPSCREKMVAMWEKYVATNPKNDAELAGIKAILAREKGAPAPAPR